VLVGKGVDQRGNRCSNPDGCLNLITNSFGNLLDKWHTIYFCNNVTVFKGGGFVDNNRGVKTVLSSDLLARGRKSHLRYGRCNRDGIGCIEVGWISFTLHQNGSTDWSLRTNCRDNIFAFFLISNLLVDKGHRLANSFHSWGASLGFKWLMLNPASADKMRWSNQFSKN